MTRAVTPDLAHFLKEKAGICGGRLWNAGRSPAKLLMFDEVKKPNNQCC
jgi:hypothetical protein